MLAMHGKSDSLEPKIDKFRRILTPCIGLGHSGLVLNKHQEKIESEVQNKADSWLGVLVIVFVFVLLNSFMMCFKVFLLI